MHHQHQHDGPLVVVETSAGTAAHLAGRAGGLSTLPGARFPLERPPRALPGRLGGDSASLFAGDASGRPRGDGRLESRSAAGELPRLSSAELDPAPSRLLCRCMTRLSCSPNAAVDARRLHAASRPGPRQVPQASCSHVLGCPAANAHRRNAAVRRSCSCVPGDGAGTPFRSSAAVAGVGLAPSWPPRSPPSLSRRRCLSLCSPCLPPGCRCGSSLPPRHTMGSCRMRLACPDAAHEPRASATIDDVAGTDQGWD